MLTQCPNCDTTFRVTSEILRVAQGQVRCGRCQTQFDALQRLIEENPAPAPAGRSTPVAAAQAAPVAAETAAILVEEPDTLEEITMEGKRIEISGTYRVIDDANADGEPQLRKEVVEEWMEIEDSDADDSEQVPQGYIDVSDEPDARADLTDLEDSQGRLLHDFSSADTDDDATATDEDEPIHAWRENTAPGNDGVDAADDLSSLNSPAPRTATAPVWKLLAAPLLLLLLAQTVHHNRADLARHPRLGAPLMALYNALHLQLTPDWDLHAYEIKQWGVITDMQQPGTLKVRASIVNHAAFPQPYPLLKLALEDRWGDQVRAREFEPSEYLDHGVATDRLFTSNQQANATIVIVDPGPDAEGFRFDVCLHGDAGTVCAADLPR